MKQTSVALMVLAAALFGCRPPAEEPVVIRPVRAMKIADTAELEARWFPGRAQATQEVNIAFEVAGRIIERPVDVGDHVETGEMLARLDPSDFQNELAAAKAQRDQAEAFRDRIEIAAKTGAVAQQEVTDARAQFDVAAATVRIKEKALADTQVVAPFTGTIATTFAENFQNVQAKEAVVRLLDTTKIEMVINIPEGLISLAPFVTEVIGVFDSFPDREVSGTIKEIGNEASETTRTFPVTVIMDQPEDFKILPGMSGRVSGRGQLPQDMAQTGFEVPASAVFEGNDGQIYVWTIDETSHRVTRVPVEPGRITSRGMMVKGLEAGQWIATAGVHFLEEGQEVRIMKPAAERSTP